MTTHLRRLTPAQLAALPGETDAARAWGIGGVLVAQSGGDHIVEVAGPDSYGLPGAFEAADYASLHPSTRRNVLRARWQVADPETDDVTEHEGRVADVPEGAAVIETDIVPHRFA